MIYIDLLVIEDLFLNYIILLAISILLNRITNLKKIFLSSVIGLIPLIFLFINISPLLLLFISVLFSFLMSLIAFGYKDIIYTIKNIIYMYFISIFLAGAIYLINTKIFYKIDNYLLSVIILIILSPVITYFYIKSISKLRVNYSNYYKVDIYLRDGEVVTINTYLDTGNKLVDPYSRSPIIIINKNKIKYIENIILVPYNTIDSHNLMRCIKPYKVYIYGVGERRKVLIGLVDEIGIEGADGILNGSLLERMRK